MRSGSRKGGFKREVQQGEEFKGRGQTIEGGRRVRRRGVSRKFFRREEE